MNSYKITVLAETLQLTVSDGGIGGRPYLLLHGGAGPNSMMGLAKRLAQTGRALLPTHPGFEGQPRPEWFHRVDELATAYLALIEQLDLHDVVVVGNSVGGWIAVEIGLRASPRVSALVLMDAVGLDTTAETGEIVDPVKLAPMERAAYAFHDPARFAIAPSDPAGIAVMAANQQSLRVYAGEPFMYDQSLRSRLTGLVSPTLILWGESDRIVTPAYGRQFAEIIPSAQFELLPKAGHFPQIEQLDEVAARIQIFADQS